MSAIVHHRRIEVDGVDVFYREAGPADAPVVLLPHGYPCSSFEFRRYMAELGDRWHLVAPDLPGWGYSATPDDFDYSFAGQGAFLGRFADALGLQRYALYLHDYGSQFGYRLALARPERVTALIIQNGDVYEDALGPKYATLLEHWRNPTPDGRARLAEAVSEDGFRDEFLGELPEELRDRLTPDLWTLAWRQLDTPRRRELIVDLFEDQATTLPFFADIQAYLREHRPPTLIVWGPHDGYMPEESARAYLRDLPDAELHLLGGGHWLLETHLDEVVALSRDFLGRVHSD
ncbi:pimeloyl-ACP methyl ester carboxylesterase [Diaminobutyricimonas aerilata]|uniref:Pimeloyl-ACP methyl ester carboxylesterase n=1 Tax=Diaminobutyricimonas aerilata TaxID=1162967 RepID=A0A2M9CHI1_9MICO|nr:alpha/beta hydrolase [Diaminobutyricimonas aerilata]PJJ71373.1 pimeloyl-ACP methyl ester carboxylesterase [Diaminobutyricimonas aerilata]